MSVLIKGVEMPKNCFTCRFKNLEICYDDCPLTEVPPHGRWIKTVGENGVTSACRCSNCGFADNRYSLFNYCPVCGERMVGET